MALRRTLAKHQFNSALFLNSPVEITLDLQNAARLSWNRDFSGGFFRRFLHRRATAAKLPDLGSIPVGERLREKLRSINASGERIRLDGLVPPPPQPPVEIPAVSIDDAKKILRCSVLEKVRAKIREIPASSVSYSEFVRICGDVCRSREKGLEFAKMLDDSGSVIVLSDVVLLCPDKVAKTMEKLIWDTIAKPNDPRRKELELMESQKALIDQKAQSQVKGELYCGLGFLALQTLGFMRLTFWELSWDVMEPICFFVTSLHFGVAYTFFLRTSKEPSFEGYFQRRFKSKQEKLMKIHNFDLDKYNKLRSAFSP